MKSGKRAQTAQVGRPRPKGGLTSARSPSKKGARRPAARTTRTTSTGNSPFQPLEQRLSPSPMHRGQPLPDGEASNGFPDETITGGDVLQNLTKDDREIVLLMVDMLSRQSHVDALRTVASLSHHLEVERYIRLYGGTFDLGDSKKRVQDLDGRRELIEHLSSRRQQYAEEGGRDSEQEAREAKRSEWIASNSKKFSTASKAPKPKGKKARGATSPSKGPHHRDSDPVQYLANQPYNLSADYTEASFPSSVPSPYKSSQRVSESHSPMAAKAAPSATQHEESLLKDSTDVAPPVDPVVSPPVSAPQEAPAPAPATGGLDWLLGGTTAEEKAPSIDKEEPSTVDHSEDDIEDEIEDDIEEEEIKVESPSAAEDESESKMPWDDI